MKVIPDLAARMIALTAVDRTLLVEAGAGSGKTSVMAGRVAVLFAGGVEPKHIAAITFTEFAASELRLRIERFTTALSRGGDSLSPPFLPAMGGTGDPPCGFVFRNPNSALST